MEPIPKDEQTKIEYYQQLQRDALWSDPIDVVAGISPSPRGAGVNFGPDLA